MEMKDLDLQNIQKILRKAIKESGIPQKEIAALIGFPLKRLPNI